MKFKLLKETFENEVLKADIKSNIIATPPGATIQELLIDQNISIEEFAERMEMPKFYISKLIDGEIALTPECADKLEQVLGVPARFWNKLELQYRNKLEQK